MQTFFATIFAALLTMGATLLPVYQCVCGDGSKSVQVGQAFCEGEHGPSHEASIETLGSPNCAGFGCDSRQIGEDLAIQPTANSHFVPGVPASGPFYTLTAEVELHPRIVMAHDLAQSRGDPDPVLLRSIILLV
jgi:hypothetical protein